MSIDSEFEAEEQELEDRLNDGEINLSQYNKEMQQLQREYRAMANEACQEAYDNEAENWH
jgi:hypothetical protein